MLVKFSVVVFAGPNTRIAVVGSIPELGSWKTDAATPLYPQEVPISSYVPTYFSAIVDVESQGTQHLGNFRFKFIKWEIERRRGDDPTTVFPTPPPHSGVPLIDGCYLYEATQLRLPAPLQDVSDHIVSSYGNPPSGSHDVTWEGSGPHHDRLLLTEASSLPDTEVCDKRLVHIYSTENLFPNDAGDGYYYAIPPADFMDPVIMDPSHKSEYIQTTRYYERVKELRSIHFNEIIPRVYCGSCPRKLSHLTTLRDKYNIGTVLCLQSYQDIERNWIDDDAFPHPADRNHFTLIKIYKDHNVQLVHIPTEDMSTEARAAMMAQAAWTLAGILVNRPDSHVYVHCNAGVGRATASVCAFLCFCLGLSEAHTMHLIRSRRPVAYFDSIALHQGKYDFDAKFGSVLRLLPIKAPHSGTYNS